MRRTKTGARNKQDWDAKEHDRAGHPQTLAPLPLARHLLTVSTINLETAASKLNGQPSAQAAVQQALRALAVALELL